jgi:hypothetical protein
VAITDVKHLPQSEESQRSKDGTKSCKLSWLVYTDGASSTVEAETAAGIPALGSVHPSDTSRVAKSVSAKFHSEKANVILVTVDYGEVENEGEQEDTAPWDEPDEVSWEDSEGNEPFFRDVDDKPVVNSAGEPFEDFLERDSGELSVTINRNSLDYSASQSVGYRNVINSAPFTLDGASIGKGEAKMSGISAKTAYYEGTKYYQITYKLKLRETWKVKIEDRGYNEKDTTNTGKVKPILKGTPPVPVDKPWPLDGAGAKKANSTDKPSQLEFKPYKEKSFSVFNFS